MCLKVLVRRPVESYDSGTRFEDKVEQAHRKAWVITLR
jgi:hypothetical protein